MNISIFFVPLCGVCESKEITITCQTNQNDGSCKFSTMVFHVIDIDGIIFKVLLKTFSFIKKIFQQNYIFLYESMLVWWLQLLTFCNICNRHTPRSQKMKLCHAPQGFYYNMTEKLFPAEI